MGGPGRGVSKPSPPDVQVPVSTAGRRWEVDPAGLGAEARIAQVGGKPKSASRGGSENNRDKG